MITYRCFINFAIFWFASTTFPSASIGGILHSVPTTAVPNAVVSTADFRPTTLLLAEKTIDLLPGRLKTRRIRIEGHSKKRKKITIDLLPERIKTERISFTGVKASSNRRKIDLLPASIRTPRIKVGR